MDYLTVEDARRIFSGMGTSIKLCPSCLSSLALTHGEDYDYLMCPNEMCLDETEHPI